jgi:hypothetical protein
VQVGSQGLGNTWGVTTPSAIVIVIERLSVIPFYFIVLFLLLTLNLGSSDEGNAQSHTDGLAREGFPCILWEVL